MLLLQRVVCVVAGGAGCAFEVTGAEYALGSKLLLCTCVVVPAGFALKEGAGAACWAVAGDKRLAQAGELVAQSTAACGAALHACVVAVRSIKLPARLLEARAKRG